jgi:hypothetical protein
MERFPIEIKRIIFEFDPTKKEVFDKVVHQINFAPCLDRILCCANDPYLKIQRWNWVKEILYWNNLQENRKKSSAYISRRLGWASFRKKLLKKK